MIWNDRDACHIDANLSNQTIHADTRQLDHGVLQFAHSNCITALPP